MFLLKKLSNPKILYWLLFGLIIFAWWRFRLSLLIPHTGDAWIYWYAGKEVLDGNIPYRDFFYSSPPLIPYLTAALQTFGFNLKAALILPHVLNIISATLIFTFFSLRKQFQAGLLAAVAFLFTGVIFSHGDFLLGSTVVTPFVILGFIFFERKNLLFSGAFFGLATLTKFYGIVPALFLLPLVKNRKDFFNFCLGGFITFGIPNLVFWALTGNEYWDLIFFNHFKKPVTEKAFAFWGLLKYDTALIATFLAGLWLQRKNAALKAAVLAAGGILVFCLFFIETFYHYFEPLAAILAILFGYLFVEKNKPFKKFILPVVLSLLLFNSIFSLWAYYKNDSVIASIPNFEKMVELVESETEADEQIYGVGTLAPLLALETGRDFFGKNFDTFPKWEGMSISLLGNQVEEIEAAKVPLIILDENRIKSLKPSQIYFAGELLSRQWLHAHCRILSSFGYAEYTFWRCFE